MAENATDNKVKIMLDKERNLHYTLNSLIKLEESIGVPMAELSTVKLSIKNIRTFLYVGLEHEDKSLTEEQVGDMVSLENLNEVQESLKLAFNKANPKNS